MTLAKYRNQDGQIEEVDTYNTKIKAKFHATNETLQNSVVKFKTVTDTLIARVNILAWSLQEGPVLTQW